MTVRPGATGARDRPDLRAPAVGLVGWLSALAVLHLPGWVLAGVLGTGGVAVVLARRDRRLTVTAWLLVALVVAGATALHVARVERSGLGGLVRDRASVHARIVVRSDPVQHQGRFHDFVTFRAEVLEAAGRGRRIQLRAAVLVIADPSWRSVRLGATLSVGGRLDAADDPALAGVLATRGPPVLVSRAPAALRAVDRLRAGIRDAASGHDRDASALVPALVDGDDAGVDDALAAEFRTSGLTHLLAVSGTNLTLIVGFLLVLARWTGVRARGLFVVGAVGVAGFVALARTEPSVVRAAAMGSVALLGMGSNGRQLGVRALGVAVCALVLFDPWLADSPGFALSVCATAGILLLAPGWRDALLRWLPAWSPRWVAEAVAVPLAAQLACTPIVAALSGQVSLVAVGANLLAAPAVGPATVLGLLGGLAHLVWATAGSLIAAPAVWCASWLIAVARGAAGLPLPAVGWPTTAASLLALTAACLLLALSLGRVLARRSSSLAACGLGVVVLLVPLPTPGWPPPGWVFVACDVGQGDALVLNAGGGSAVVVDTGPDPVYVDRCLARLHVRQVPLVVLTHFHADHVDGLEGVLDGRRAGEVVVSPVADPLAGVRQVHAVASAAGVPVRTVEFGERGRLGQLRWQVLAPSRTSFPDSGSPPNDGSIVLLVEVRGVRLLLMGDEEGPSQDQLQKVAPQLRADVLKVAHHGSSKQDEQLIDELGARLAVISCGRDNDYGHPAAAALRMLRRAGVQVARTDTSGDVAVVVDGRGGLRLRTRIPLNRPPPGSGGTT
ncbi:MAG TPA: DNA internalization-related competence protein ComEC/Rec2 [Marmoricola sp.]|nr:DNA internalization-related competence protein ComEC/Rec2 [Marmoricola sp.]